MRTIRVVVFLMTMGCAAMAQDQVTTFILVRHGEKENIKSDDPPLTAEGRARANRLATLFSKTGLNAIYTTSFSRTRETVTPLAKATGLTLRTYDAMKKENIDAIVKEFPGGTILICGHSNTIPAIANILVRRADWKNYEDTLFSIILIATVNEKTGHAKITRMDY